VPQQFNRIIQPREVGTTSDGGWLGVFIFCAITLGIFAYMLMTRGRDLFWPRVAAGVFALAGVAGAIAKYLQQASLQAFGPMALEMDEPGPAVGGTLRAALRLPASQAGIVTGLRAELSCNAVARSDDNVKRTYVWGKVANFPVAWRSGEGVVQLVIEIPYGLPHSVVGEENARGRSESVEWDLKVTGATSGETLERNYDLQVLPAADAARAAATPKFEPLGSRMGAGLDEPIAVAQADWSSAWALAAANLMLIAGVMGWGWRVEELVFVCWIEVMIIGACNIPRILLATPKGLERWRRLGFAPTALGTLIGNVALAVLFVAHYGYFSYLLGEALSALILSGRGVYGAHTLGGALHAILRDPLLLAAVAGLAASHVFSLAHNYFGRGEYEHANFGALMGRPYLRILATQLFVAAGGVALLHFDSPYAYNIAFVVIKIAIDLYAHRASRQGAAGKSYPMDLTRK
jgi:hypothetical protein